MPAISVIICTYNRASILDDFLNRLESHVLNLNLDAEIVLVDNNSSDATPQVLANFKANSKLRICTAHEAKQGANHARNTGIRKAQSPLLVFTDDDVEFTDTWLKDFLDYMQSHPECQVATGEIIPKFMQPRPAWLTDSMLNYYGQQNLGGVPVDMQFPVFPVEMNMVVRAQIFERYGGFCAELGRDAKSLMSNDGKLLFYRLSQNKEIVRYIPCACLFHLIPATRTTPAWFINRNFWQGISEVTFQKLIKPQNRLAEILSAVPALFKLLNQLRGGHLSPRRIRWHWRCLPVSAKAWHAYQWGALSRKFGLK
jgi:glucosyl-dolichyl phosphate glucuronosyltransferase